jgi:hypothetical protein
MDGHRTVEPVILDPDVEVIVPPTYYHCRSPRQFLTDIYPGNKIELMRMANHMAAQSICGGVAGQIQAIKWELWDRLRSQPDDYISWTPELLREFYKIWILYLASQQEILRAFYFPPFVVPSRPYSPPELP